MKTSGRVKQARSRIQRDALARVGALLLRARRLFFERDVMTLEEAPHRRATAEILCLRIAQTISSSVKSGCS